MLRSGLLLFLLLGAAHGDEPAWPEGGCIVGKMPLPGKDPDAALRKAAVGGKYRMLLRQIKVPGDAATYGFFHDYGWYQALAAYEGHRDLPAGYWVYVFPYWYVWRDTGPAAPPRAWGPGQATGAPNSEPGDRRTAWAPARADAGAEWLLLEYAEPVRPLAVLVYENLGPGAVVKVTGFTSDGREVTLWEGRDPVANGVTLLRVRGNARFQRIKVYLDTERVKGWNEIDAVGVLDHAGRTHWATSAHASSSYRARPIIATPFPLPEKRK